MGWAGRLFAALLCCAAGSASADDTTVLHYTVRLHGLALLEASFCFHLETAAYQAALTARTVGLVEFLVHGRSQIRVDGAIDPAGHVKPRAYEERSRLSGEEYGVAIDFPAGDPVLRRLAPPQQKYRLPIPPDAMLHAIDALSAVAVQSLAAGAGRCAGDTRLYDGRQVRLLSLRNGVRDRLERQENSVFEGDALRCDTESAMLAGFLNAESVERQSRPRHGRLWLAPVLPGGPAVPVRMVFDADAFGTIVVQLDAATPTKLPECEGDGWAADIKR